MDWIILERFFGAEQVEPVREYWEELSPHPVIELHPLLTIATALVATIYWVIGTPLLDLLSFLKRGITLSEAVWNWILPTAVQSLFASYSGLRVIFVLGVLGLFVRARDKGVGHLLTKDIGPAVKTVLGGLAKIPVIVLSALGTVISDNDELIADIVSGVISSLIFKALVVLGLVGALFTFLGL